MFLDIKLYNKMHIDNCLVSDGGYKVYISQFKEQSLIAGKNFSDKNFMYPIRKKIEIYHLINYIKTKNLEVLDLKLKINFLY